MTYRLTFLAALFIGLMNAEQARSGELIYFGSSACTYCEDWDDAIGGIYPKTDEAKILPLRRVDIHDPRPADLAFIKGVHFTPTFVAIEDGKEVGRISGYPGEIVFWDLMAVMMNEVHDYRLAACAISDADKPQYC